MIHRGDWVPLLPVRVRTVVVGVLPVEPLVRGLDYLLPGGLPASYSVVERAMPAWCWGVLCLLAAALIAAGYIGKWPRPAIWGYWLGGCTYLTMAIGAFASAIRKPWWDGIRSPCLLLVFAVAFLGMSIGYAQQSEGRQ